MDIMKLYLQMENMLFVIVTTITNNSRSNYCEQKDYNGRYILICVHVLKEIIVT